MPERIIAGNQWRPTLARSVAIFVVFTAGMAYLRLHLFHDRTVALTYGLPLLLCLWYPSRRLLWAMAGAFVAMSTCKVFLVSPDSAIADADEAIHFAMQLTNILVIAAAVHIIINLRDRWRARTAELQHANEQLRERETESSRQNKELQAQAEELAEQNEEIRQQSEELQQQAEEIQAQTEELQAMNAELSKRQTLLENLLQSLNSVGTDGDAPRRSCESALTLFGGSAVAATIVLRDSDGLAVYGSAGTIAVAQAHRPLAQSLAAIVMEHAKPAAVNDLALRPDLVMPDTSHNGLHSVLAAPLWLGGQPAGALEIYSDEPQEWTQEQFQIIEWAAAQCSLILQSRRLHENALSRNVALDRLVQNRTEELQELVNEMEHFSYTITHDLRAPLRAMHGYAGLLEEECLASLNEAGRSYLHRIATAAKRMDQLITDALSYSKAVRHELAMTAVDPAKLLRDMLESYPIFQLPNAHVELDGDIPPVLANEAGLTQCFSNLLGNAVKFVQEGTMPHVRIRAERRADLVRLWFEDNGIGIAPEMQSRLFKMFQRLSRDYEGTGIGLALVRKVAERMGGNVGVESEPGRGSRFWMDLKSASSTPS